MRFLFFMGMVLSVLLAKPIDFSEMSTEELIALIGYIDKADEPSFYEELEERQMDMSDEQKHLYDNDKKRRDDEQTQDTPARR